MTTNQYFINLVKQLALHICYKVIKQRRRTIPSLTDSSPSWAAHYSSAIAICKRAIVSAPSLSASKPNLHGYFQTACSHPNADAAVDDDQSCAYWLIGLRDFACRVEMCQWTRRQSEFPTRSSIALSGTHLLCQCTDVSSMACSCPNRNSQRHLRNLMNSQLKRWLK